MSSLADSEKAAAIPGPQNRVVLIHCSASSARQWKTLTDQLVDFKAIPLDLRGHGSRGRWHGTGP